MRIPSQTWRLLVLLAIIVAPTFTSDLTTKPRLILNAILLIGFVLLLLPTGQNYLRTLPGKLELLGAGILVLSFGLTVCLVWLNGSEYLGVLIGGALGLLYMAAMSLCFIGAIWGLVKAKQSNARPEPPK